jgi:hypothetical protein
MLRRFVAALGLTVLAQPQEPPPPILEVYRDRLKPGSEPTYAKVAADAARICVELKCPHPYLSIESLTGPPQVWYLNGFDSQHDAASVGEAYRKNGPLTAALNEIVQRHRTQLISESSPWKAMPGVNTFMHYRQSLSRGAPWSLGRGRFLVITETRAPLQGEGTVFEAGDGFRLVIRAAQTRAEANAWLAGAARETNIFAVRPDWSLPATDWLATDPAFWQIPAQDP